MDFNFLKDLNDQQKNICISNKNYILIACPGCGKTRTLTYKLAYMAEKYSYSRKWNIAITYTNRAAEEIENRLIDMNISLDNVWTGTIHQFCMCFIIRPYAIYSDRLKFGYKIIDEHVVQKYIKEIVERKGIKYDFRKNYFECPEINSDYQKYIMGKKEIDFDSILNISNELITKNKFIAEDIAHIVRSLYIDEFQDTNELQYRILGTIVRNNKNINMLFVGDTNQAIYRNLGGVIKTRNEIECLMGLTFEEVFMLDCYRSTQKIINYYNNFAVEYRNIYSLYCNSEFNSRICYNYEVHKNELVDKIAEIIQYELRRNISEKEICIVAPQWYLLFELSLKLRNRLPHINFDSPEISPFKPDPLNPFFLLARLIYTVPGELTIMRKRTANKILKIFEEEYQLTIDQKINSSMFLKIVNSYQNNTVSGIEYYEECSKWILNAIGIKINNEEFLNETLKMFIDKSKSRIKRYNIINTNENFKTYFCEKSGIVISSIHGIKGKEYKTVIAFGLLNGFIPHWDFIMKPEMRELRINETKKLLYVLCSRAKENIYLFSEKGRFTKKCCEYIATNELKQLNFCYDIIYLK